MIHGSFCVHSVRAKGRSEKVLKSWKEKMSLAVIKCLKTYAYIRNVKYLTNEIMYNMLSALNFLLITNLI
jgi:hypothetical protein